MATASRKASAAAEHFDVKSIAGLLSDAYDAAVLKVETQYFDSFRESPQYDDLVKAVAAHKRQLLHKRKTTTTGSSSASIKGEAKDGGGGSSGSVSPREAKDGSGGAEEDKAEAKGAGAGAELTFQMCLADRFGFHLFKKFSTTKISEQHVLFHMEYGFFQGALRKGGMSVEQKKEKVQLMHGKYIVEGGPLQMDITDEQRSSVTEALSSLTDESCATIYADLYSERLQWMETTLYPEFTQTEVFKAYKDQILDRATAAAAAKAAEKK